MLKWVLNRPFQCKYVEALKDITKISNAMYTFSKCNQPKDMNKSNENILQTKNILSYFISPFDNDLRYAPSLFNIVSGTLAPEIVQDVLLSIKDAGKELQELFEERITGYSNANFFFILRSIL